MTLSFLVRKTNKQKAEQQHIEILYFFHNRQFPHKQTSGLCCSSARAVLLSAEPLRTAAVVVVDLDTVLLHQLH